MRIFLLCLAGCLSFSAWAAPVEQSPEAIKAQLQDYYFDAARRGDVPMLETFIESGYSLDTRDGKGYTALILAAYHGQRQRLNACSPLAQMPVLRTNAVTRR